ncbi:MAG: ABC transporter substrate-binding protein [Candidatus Ozemobacteraceae bacterium]
MAHASPCLPRGPGSVFLTSCLLFFLPFFLLFLISPAASGEEIISSSQALTSSIRIGVVGALSGPKAPYGRSQLRGAELAAKEINETGGVNGRMVEVISADDQGNSGEVGVIADALIHRQKVSALLGSVDSGCTHVLAMLAVKCHIPHVSCVATDPSLTRAGTPWTFRTLADDERQASALIVWLREKRVSSVGLIAGDSRYGKMGAKSFARQARAMGIRVDGPRLVSVSITSSTETSSTKNSSTEGSSTESSSTENSSAETPSNVPAVEQIVTEALRGHPDAVIIWSLAREGITIAAALKKFKFQGIIAGGDGLATPAFFSSAAEAAEGIVVTCPYIESARLPLNEKFREEFKKSYSESPDSFAAHAWDTLRLIAEAHRHAGSAPSSDALRESLATIGSDFPGATGNIALDATGNDTRPVRLAQCHAGRLEPLP